MCSKDKYLKRSLIFLSFICQILFFITAVPAQTLETPPPVTQEIEVRASVSDKEQEGVVGIAGYFARRFHGRRTSSGEVYDPAKLTAAHPTLPYGTRVKVLNLTNNQSAVIRIIDRCRKRSFEFIDLSRAAARKLGFFGKGTAKVRIIPINK